MTLVAKDLSCRKPFDGKTISKIEILRARLMGHKFARYLRHLKWFIQVTDFEGVKRFLIYFSAVKRDNHR